MLTNAGYSSVRNGKASLKKTEFFTALSAAQGLQTGETHALVAPPTKLPSQSQCARRLLGAFADMINVQPGEYVKIEQEDDCLILTKVQAA